MFKSIQYLNSLGYNQDTQKYEFLYKIIDDDFGEEVIVSDAVPVARASTAALAHAVIKCYSQKSFPIAPNLFRFIQWYSQKYNFNKERITFWLLKYCSFYRPYHEDVQKYFVL